MSTGEAFESEAVTDLGSGTYTALRLQHATAQHLHLTTRRIFVGPIPEGWLKSHRTSWLKNSFNLSNYSSRAATFTASFNSQRTHYSGRDGPSAEAFNASFPQPDDVGEEENEEREEGEIDGSTSRQTAGISNTDEVPPLRSRRTTEKLKATRSKKSLSSPSFTTARSSVVPSTQKEVTPVMAGLNTSAASAASSQEEISHPQEPSGKGSDQPLTGGPSGLSNVEENEGGHSSSHSTTKRVSGGGYSILPGDALSSTASLIPHAKKQAGTSPTIEADLPLLLAPVPASTGLVRFNVPSDVVKDETRLKSDIVQSASRRRSWKRRGKAHPGAIVKMEKMLVRVDSTLQKLPPDYNENESIKMEFRTVAKWCELVIVCRESTDDVSDFSLQMYKSRVIPAIDQTRLSKRAAHEIPLIPKSTQVNLYSTLDKTLVIWVPWKTGTRIYLLRTRSAANAVEWYTFLRHSLGWQRSSELQVHVPDLSVTLKLEDPFGELEASRKATYSAETDNQAVLKTIEAEKAVAGTILTRCMDLLEESPEWAHILEAWAKNEKMGLAWKRYDRLEWVHGANEQRMYGTIAMQKTHDLELRPKHHYPTTVKSEDGGTKEEPSPMEGFLVRLTSQQGRITRYGKMFYKRLYFATHNQYLCYCRPAKALPPPPPKLTLGSGGKIPSAQHIVNHTPLIYTVDPYPTTEGKIDWLKTGTSANKEKYDRAAYKEAERKVNTLLHAEGHINLTHVVRVQDIQRGNSPADQNLEQGPNVDFHESVPDTTRDDGKTKEFDDDRTFELVLRNGLMIRLQAYDVRTKKEWMIGLDNLVKYWKLRLADDMHAFKITRQLNLATLDIDEEMESMLGQFADKWEVNRAVASPQLFNMCGISCCRAITISGVLYRKPRRHSTFVRCSVILCHGQLLIFHSTVRERTGKEIPHIQHDRQTVINLKDCYIYSGLVTESDLLYRNQTFDSNHPGHHALPKIYLEDGWTSHDEDTMTSFVIWQGSRKSLFRTHESTDNRGGGTSQRLRFVSSLGVPGRAIVFKARSRPERDHWVLSIGMEIDRLQTREHLRVQ
ncbi:hypothetical protein MMC31_006657 [Peltigera leucophlebia]|nr:hypothetical protein [Peltigera leucophlebia]